MKPKSNKTPKTSRVYEEDEQIRVEYWTRDDIKELRQELDVESKIRFTDFTNTSNIWD